MNTRWWSGVGRRWSATCALLLTATAGAAEARQGPNAAQPDQAQLRRLSIEELMQIDVTIASREAQPVRTTPAAVSVITGEDIRRAGVTTIADALLLADGVHVARVNTGAWSISARGFNGSTPNKMLVMVDGRTVYSPLFTGVFWNTVDYILEDIDRIEVIRGPGAALWGANAVNGVINIITRHSANTQGPLASLSSGNEDRAILEARYGGTMAIGTTWRVYGKFAARDQQYFSDGEPSGDDRNRGQVGFRIDSGMTGSNSWLVKGDAFHSRDNLAGREDDGEFTDLNLQGRWTSILADGSQFSVQSYYRREYRRIPGQLTHYINIFDVDGQHSTTFGPRHQFVWGAGARVNRDNTYSPGGLVFDPVRRTYPVFSVFGQDTFELLPNRLSLTGGIKWEHNAFSGGDVQPSGRVRLQLPGPGAQILWGAVSRAVRRPTRLDRDLRVVGPGGLVLLRGTEDYDAEKLLASEVGYRVQPSRTVSLDATVFHHRFTDLRSQDRPPVGILPILIGNSLQGHSRGVELALNLQPIDTWRTHLGYTWLDTEIEPAPGSRDISGGISEANDPHHLLTVRTSVDLPHNLELDAMVRSVGALPNPPIPSYTEMNLRVGWLATPRLDLWLVGHDLLHDRHPENRGGAPRAVEFERGVRAGLTVRF